MRVTWPWLFLSSTVGMLSQLGCNVPDSVPSKADSQDPVSAAEEAIQGGYADNTDSNVVGIFNITQGALCSGSLIAPNEILTARHCVSTITNEAAGVDCAKTTAAAPFPASSFYITTKPSMNSAVMSDFVGVKEVIPAPGKDQKLCGNDQTILILTRSLTPQEATPLIPRVDSQVAVKEQYSAAGYGDTSDQAGNAGNRRRRDKLFANCAEADCKGVASFVTTSEWIGDTGICSGDSGGPALDLEGRVVGVTSRGGPGCTSPVYGSVHSWGQWIMDTTVHAAEVGGYDPPAWATGFTTDPTFNLPIGGACDATCASGICLADQCTRQCNDTAPCPANYDCIAINDTQSACQLHQDPPSASKTPVTTTTTTCDIGSGADPTNPVPWLGGAVAFIAMAGLGRRARRR